MSWMGIFVPSGTPADVVRKLEAEILQAANSPDVREQLRRVGLEASPVGTAEFTTHVKRDVGNWAQVIKDVGAKTE